MSGPGQGDPLLDVRDLVHRFETPGREVTTLAGLTFEVRPGELVAVVGPSGCGKTTLIRVIGGLLAPSSGTIEVAGKRTSGPPPDLLVLFQQYEKSLLPWRSVESNVRFGVQNVGIGSQEQRRRVDEALEAVGLSDFARHHPSHLSGGMQQRVALARALARRPKILLMDEPFSSLDALTRADLQDLMLDLWKERGQTILFVTHDVDEAVYLANRVLVLSPRPATIREEVQVPLGYPRHQMMTRESSAFLQARRQILRLIHDEPEMVDAGQSANVSA